jgi:uncharacterized protein (TIGR03437 family)
VPQTLQRDHKQLLARIWRAADRTSAQAEGTAERERTVAPRHRRPHRGEAGIEGHRRGKLLSPERRREAVEHAREQGISERRACRLVDQPRGTQRYQPLRRIDEDPLTQAILTLASEYGRYGYRRITQLLRDERVGLPANRARKLDRCRMSPPGHFTCVATLAPLSSELCGASEEFTSSMGAQALAPLLYVSPTQIKFQMSATQWPLGINPVELNVSSSPTVRACVKPAGFCRDLVVEEQGPATFLYWRGDTADPIITHANGALVTPTNPASLGETLMLYATRFGRFRSFPLDGSPAPLDRLIEIPPTSVHIETGKVGGLSIGQSTFVSVEFAGLAPGFIGLQQINFRISESYGFYNVSQKTTYIVLMASSARPARVVRSLCTLRHSK